MGLIDHLGPYCAELRREADVTRQYVATLLGRTELALSNFEVHATLPREPDAVVNAYALVAKKAPAEVWGGAMDRWVAAEPQAASPDGIPSGLAAVEEALRVAADAQASARASRRGSRRTAASKRG